MDGWTAPWHWIVLLVLVAALFGYKKLPDAARSVGRSLRIFKTEMKGLVEDDAARHSAKADTHAPAEVAPAEVASSAAPAQAVSAQPAQAPAPAAEAVVLPEPQAEVAQ